CGEELAADTVLLYGPDVPWGIELMIVVDEPRVITREEMIERGYPNPRGSAYFCLSVRRIAAADLPAWLSPELLRAVREKVRPGAPRGTPVATTWQEVLCSGR